MFTQLVESKPARKRSSTGTAVSFVAHYGLILVVIYTSAEAADVDSRPREEKIIFEALKKTEPSEKPPSEPELIVAPAPPKTVPVLTAPIEIPNTLPEIDLRNAPTDPTAYSGKRNPGFSGGTQTEAEPAPRADKDYFASEVEKPVVQAPNSAAPAYPDVLRQAGVEGEALVSFVVDTLGRVDLATFKVIHTTHDLFAAAVKNALPRMRFIPAETSRGRVRQLVQQPFSFAIVK
jgi:protein TonB